MEQAIIIQFKNGPHEDKKKQGICVLFAMSVYLLNMALTACLHYSSLNFQFSNQVLHINFLIDIQLQNDQYRLRLTGVVYYGQHHFCYEPQLIKSFSMHSDQF